MYDLVAGSKTVKSSYLLSKKNALELFPMLRGDKLCGAIVYYDGKTKTINCWIVLQSPSFFKGQQDDARMNLAVALTATRHGATVANHVMVTNLLKSKDETGRAVVSGVAVRDEITGKEWSIPAKCVINATGPFTDSIRKMDNPNVKGICCPSSGVHIVLPGKRFYFLFRRRN